jgi:hypothetical protein
MLAKIENSGLSKFCFCIIPTDFLRKKARLEIISKR